MSRFDIVMLIDRLYPLLNYTFPIGVNWDNRVCYGLLYTMDKLDLRDDDYS